MGQAIRIEIKSSADIVEARRAGRSLSLEAGFCGTDVTLIIAAVSELARNIVDHAVSGKLTMRKVVVQGRKGISIVAEDRGPGIPDIEAALEHGYSTNKGLGAGLPGVKKLMDEFEIKSAVGGGTKIVIKKWLVTPFQTKPS